MSEVPTHITVRLGANRYTYFNHEPDIAVGDYVVVWLGGGPSVAPVVSTAPSPKERAQATKWIVQHVDLDKYRALTAMTPEPPSNQLKARVVGPAWPAFQPK